MLREALVNFKAWLACCVPSQQFSGKHCGRSSLSTMASIGKSSTSGNGDQGAGVCGGHSYRSVLTMCSRSKVSLAEPCLFKEVN